MDFSSFFTGLISVLILPLQLIFVPIDALLSQINGLDQVPAALNGIVSFVGSLPQTIVSLLGVSPILWNSLILLFLAYISAVPTINIIKKVWAWLRP